MERIKCSVRDVRDDDRSMLVLLAEETLHPLAEGSGHPELYCAADLLELLDRADVYVAEAEGETAGFLAVEAEGDALTLRCVCISPAFEARGVANQLVDWAEGLAIDRRLGRLCGPGAGGRQPFPTSVQGPRVRRDPGPRVSRHPAGGEDAAGRLGAERQRSRLTSPGGLSPPDGLSSPDGRLSGTRTAARPRTTASTSSRRPTSARGCSRGWPGRTAHPGSRGWRSCR